jgi:hypothetical protein
MTTNNRPQPPAGSPPPPPPSSGTPIPRPGDPPSPGLPAVHCGVSPAGSLNIRDTEFGAKGESDTFDTAAIRAAIAKARERFQENKDTTIWVPAGTYRVCPDVENQNTFDIGFGRLTFLGEDPQCGGSVLSFFAWGGQDPAGLISRRGHAFSIRPTPGFAPTIRDIRFENIRCTGNTKPNADAGKVQGSNNSPTGWDIGHKGVSIMGDVGDITWEQTQWDGFRGESIWAGGGVELGAFNIIRSKIFDCNASAISMTGAITVEECEIFNVYNGTECFAIGPNQFQRVINCTIDPSRSFAFGQWSVVHIGTRVSSALIEKNKFGKAPISAVFLSEAAHEVTIRHNECTDTQVLYATLLGLYPQFSQDYGLSNIEVHDNTITAKTKNLDTATRSFISGYSGIKIYNNTVLTTEGRSVRNFVGMPRPARCGDLEIYDNTIPASTIPFTDNGLGIGKVVSARNNVITGEGNNKFGNYIWDFNTNRNLAIQHDPSWPVASVTSMGDFADGKPLELVNLSTRGCNGWQLSLSREGRNSDITGVHVPPAPWNTLERGYMLYRGSLLILQFNSATGKMDFVSYRNPTVRTRNQTEFGVFGAVSVGEILFRGVDEITLSPSVPHVFDSWTGIAAGQSILVRYNQRARFRHAAGYMEMPGGVDFIAQAPGSFIATRIGGTGHRTGKVVFTPA